MATATITIQPRVQPAEADGSKCAGCGDLIFLQAYRIVLYIGRIEHVTEGKVISRGGQLLCGSCGEVLRDRWGEVE